MTILLVFVIKWNIPCSSQLSILGMKTINFNEAISKGLLNFKDSWKMSNSTVPVFRMRHISTKMSMQFKIMWWEKEGAGIGIRVSWLSVFRVCVLFVSYKWVHITHIIYKLIFCLAIFIAFIEINKYTFSPYFYD